MAKSIVRCFVNLMTAASLEGQPHSDEIPVEIQQAASLAHSLALSSSKKQHRSYYIKCWVLGRLGRTSITIAAYICTFWLKSQNGEWSFCSRMGSAVCVWACAYTYIRAAVHTEARVLTPAALAEFCHLTQKTRSGCYAFGIRSWLLSAWFVWPVPLFGVRLALNQVAPSVKKMQGWFYLLYWDLPGIAGGADDLVGNAQKRIFGAPGHADPLRLGGPAMSSALEALFQEIPHSSSLDGTGDASPS